MVRRSNIGNNRHLHKEPRKNNERRTAPGF